MKEINNLLNSLNIKPLKYLKKGHVFLVDTKDNKFVIKKSNKKIYEYLLSRNYGNIPNIIYIDDYLVYEYVEQLDIPKEQKILDMIYLVSLLHKKTFYYKNITIDDIKEIYEDVINNINFLKIYYDVLMTSIEAKEIFSPSEYYLARNISLIYEALDEAAKDINTWYKNNKELVSMRYCLNHNNLKLDHMVDNYLISFEKAKENIPIYDLYKLYQETYNITDWYDVYMKYNKEFKLTDYEEVLFTTLILLPHKIEFKQNEFNNTLFVEKEIEYLKVTFNLIKKITKK